jgi:hypothetical protein
VLTSSRMSTLRASSLLTAWAVVLVAAGPSWQSRPTSDWTEEDAHQILTSSPWAKAAHGMIVRRQTEFERREGGNMGPERGIGFDGVGEKRTAPQLPKSIIDVAKPDRGSRPSELIPLTLRWESALPIRVAELKSGVVEPPTLAGDGYSLAVYGIPGAYFKGDPKRLGNPLKEQAVLKREGKKDVKPSSVEVFQANDGLVIVYLFPLSAEITTKDQRIEFDALIGRVAIGQFFNLDDMLFKGKLEL